MLVTGGLNQSLQSSYNNIIEYNIKFYLKGFHISAIQNQRANRRWIIGMKNSKWMLTVEGLFFLATGPV
jgi:hypothetical protein